MWLTDLRAITALTGMGLMLAGCAGGSLKDAGGAMLTPTQQYAPKVQETPETLALASHPTGLSDAQRQALAGFVAQYRQDPNAELTLRVPQGVADSLSVSRMAAQVLQTLEGMGVSRARVRMASYDGSAEPKAPVVLSYWRYTVEATDCSHTWNNVAATGSNKPTTNFGCATTANFAAMVADPRDLLRPTPEDPADNTRRQAVLGLYRKGELTSTKKDEQASGTVAKANP